MVEDPQPLTLQQRIASLNAAHIGRTPSEPPLPRPKPQIPVNRPRTISRQKTINNPREQTSGSVTEATIGNQPDGGSQTRVLPTPPLEQTSPSFTNKPRASPPPLPRRQSATPSPILPTRRPSELNGRQVSVESMSSAICTVSAVGNGAGLTPITRTKSIELASRGMAPGWGESDLPPLPMRLEGSNQAKPTPPKYTSERPKYGMRAPTSSAQVTNTANMVAQTVQTPLKPSVPPRLPARKPSTRPGEYPSELCQPASKEYEPTRKLPAVVPPIEALDKVHPPARNERSQQTSRHNEPTRKLPAVVPPIEVLDKVHRSASNEGSPHTSWENEASWKPTGVVPPMEVLDKVHQFVSSSGVNKEELPALPGPRPTANVLYTKAPTTSQPPPIPLASRPDLLVVQVTKPHKMTSSPCSTQPQHDTGTFCLICRDFSAPDHYATLFPRSQVTSIQALAQQLTAPFPSPTDKARAIFTWLHHNISYDVESFFANNVRPSTPQSVLQSGLAVCEGYAGLFATLAAHAGLESLVIGGHGKGYGYRPLAPGAVVPPYQSGHAWNAVRIDDGEWKLIDACWGAGHVQGPGLPYVRKFAPQYFTMSNEEFGIKHFPGDKEMFFLPGGQRMGWEEYMRINPVSWPSLVEPPTVFSCAPDYGIGERAIMPRSKNLSPHQGGSIRFQFSLFCPHWTLEHHSSTGPPPVFVVVIFGEDGQSKDFVPLEYVPGQGPGGGGAVWYCDIDAQELGAPGQTVTLFAITSFGERQNCRGLTVQEFREKKGRVGMAFQGVAAWELI